jgi:hypothetical protein
MIILLMFLGWLLLHTVHVTLTSIDYAIESGGYKLYVRMFFDGFVTDSRLYGNTLTEDEFSGRSLLRM